MVNIFLLSLILLRKEPVAPKIIFKLVFCFKCVYCLAEISALPGKPAEKPIPHTLLNPDPETFYSIAYSLIYYSFITVMLMHILYTCPYLNLLHISCNPGCLSLCSGTWYWKHKQNQLENCNNVVFISTFIPKYRGKK